VKITLVFSEQEGKTLLQAGKNADLANYCKTSVMWRVYNELESLKPIRAEDTYETYFE